MKYRRTTVDDANEALGSSETDLNIDHKPASLWFGPRAAGGRRLISDVTSVSEDKNLIVLEGRGCSSGAVLLLHGSF